MQNRISPEMNVADLLSLWPEAIPVFLNKRMSCVGCSMSRFENLHEVAAIYGLDIHTFLEEITRVIDGHSPPRE